MKEAIIFLTGLGIGFFSGYIFLKGKYEKDVEAESEELRQYYKNRYKKTEDIEEDTDEAETITKEAKEAFESYSADSDLEEELAETEHPDDDYREGELLNYISSNKRPPFIIRDDELDDYPHHDKMTIYYYTGDESFVDDCDNIIDDINGHLGDTIEKSNFRYNDERSMYVRNIGMGCDYEILKVDGSFSDIYTDH